MFAKCHSGPLAGRILWRELNLKAFVSTVVNTLVALQPGCWASVAFCVQYLEVYECGSALQHDQVRSTACVPPSVRTKPLENNGDRQQMTQGEDKKWITFTYHSHLVRTVTNLFKQTNLNIAFKSTNTIYQQLPHNSNNTNPSGICKIKCNTCDMAYI